MIVFQVHEPVFKTAPLFVVDCEFPQLAAYLRKHWKIEVDGVPDEVAGQMLTFSDREPWRVVWARHRPDTYERLGCLVHEVVHLVTRICQDKGIPIKAQTAEGCGDEPAAYLVDFFSREALERSGIRLVRRK